MAARDALAVRPQENAARSTPSPKSGARTFAKWWLLAVVPACDRARAANSIGPLLERTENDVIRVPWGETIEAAISLKNTSAGPVSYRARATTCACLSIGKDQDILHLAPLEVGRLVLEVEGTTRGVKTEKLMLVVETGTGSPTTQFLPVQVWTGDALFLDAPSLSFSGQKGTVLPRATLVSIVLNSALSPPDLRWEASGGLGFELENVTTTRDGALEIARYSLAVRLPADAPGSHTASVAFWFGDQPRLTLHASVLSW